MPTTLSIRTAAATALIACLSIVLFASDAGAAPRHLPLAGTTVIEGAQAGMARVVLPRDALFNHDSVTGTSFTASRAGRFQGIVMRPAGAPVTDIRSILAGQLNHCATKGCKPAADAPVDRHVTVVEFKSVSDSTFAIPAGVYDLYYLADGAPGSVTLKFEGLQGTTTIHPDTPVKSNIVTASPIAPQVGLGPIAFSGGTANPIDAPGGVLFSATPIAGQGPAAFVAGDCIFTDGPPPGNVYEGCAGAYPHTVFPIALPQPTRFNKAAGGWALVYPRNWATGGYVNGSAVSWAVNHISVAMTYNTTSPPVLDVQTPDAPSTPPPAPAGTQDAKAGGVIAAPGRTLPENRAGGSAVDRTPCPATFRTRRTRSGVSLIARSSELCVLEARLMSGRKVIARAAGVVRPRRTTTLRLRSRKAKRLTVKLSTSDQAGNTLRRTLRVR